MIMTPTLWNISVKAIQSIKDAPLWLKQQAQLNFEHAMQLPDLDVAVDGDNVRPSAKERLLKADYFDFLREQISLEPRGPEWSKILRERLTHLEPFTNKTLISIVLHSMPHSATFEINPVTEEVIHIEIH
jgi:hypothetical protein